jgi:formate dehydrogenase subunit gamma
MGEMVRKASTEEIINHWILAVSCILLIVSGYAFLFQLEQIGAVFGGFNGMRFAHNWAGVVFTVSLFATLFNYLHESLTFDADDWAWIKMGGGYLSRSAKKTPPMGKLNPGQKLYYLAILAAGIAIAVSGFAIWLLPSTRPVTLASHLLHNLAFILFVVAIPTHAYLGTLANPGTFRIMVYGTVPIEWARKKYPKWMKEIGKM